MNARIPLRRLDVLFVTVTFAFFSLALSQSSYAGRPQEQQSSQSQPPASQAQQNPQPAPPPDPSTPKPKKVWTNDDVVSLRSPADNYQAEKEAQRAAGAEAAGKKAELAKQIKEAGLTVKLPSTREETQGLIKAKEEQIRDIQDGLSRLSHDLPNAPPEQQAKIQKQIEAFTVDSQKAQLELKVLQGHLDSLGQAARSEPPSAPLSPSDPPNPE